MKCPHCEYLNGWNLETASIEEGDQGYFFSLPIKMEREREREVDREAVYACPKCGKLFIDI
jgi:uncharacterized C2H2 Zn-finger protein